MEEEMNFELELTLHETGDPFFTVKALILPKEKDIRFALVDKQDELFTAADFNDKLDTVRFKKSSEFCFFVIKGQKGAVRIVLPEWPASLGYVIRTVRFSGTLKFK